MTDEEFVPPAKTRDINKQWSEPLIESGFTVVPYVFMLCYHKLDITNAEALFILHLMVHKWSDKPPRPYFKDLAIRMDLTEQQVRSYALSLKKKGLLDKKHRPGKASLFHLEPLIAKLNEQLVEREKDPRHKLGVRPKNKRKPVS